MLPDYLLNGYFVYHSVNKFSILLLYEINVLDFFDMGDLFQIFVVSRNTEILTESNYWLGMYVPYILNWLWVSQKPINEF